MKVLLVLLCAAWNHGYFKIVLGVELAKAAALPVHESSLGAAVCCMESWFELNRLRLKYSANSRLRAALVCNRGPRAQDA